MQLTAKTATWLKRIDAQAADIADPQDKCQIKSGEKLTAIAFRKISSNCAYVTFDRGYGKGGYNTWYIFLPHFEYQAEEPQNTQGLFKLIPGRKDIYGAQLYLLTAGGLEIECISGAIGSMPCHPQDDYPGSYRPIPEGLYEVGAPMHDDRYAKPGDPIGPDWITLSPLTNIGGRSGILIHKDYNWQTSPGTAGCISPIRHRDMDVIIDLVKRNQLETLRVSYGYGVA
jgi:hypothetical protein